MKSVSPVRFLVIDDDEDDCELFEIALEDIEHKTICKTVNGCNEALALLNEGDFTPDYIFLDLNMPQVSGLECLSYLLKNKKSAHIPVIIFSTSSDPGDISETIKSGATDFVTKPPDVATLTNSILKLINQKIENKTNII